MPIPAHLDRDEPQPRAGDPAAPPVPSPAGDTGLHDLSGLWLDLGGSD